MTDLDIREDIDLTTGTSELHIACCKRPRFLCWAPYHPEAEAGPDDNEEDCCKPCVDIRYRSMCPALRPTHQHCPFNGRVCPRE